MADSNDVPAEAAPVEEDEQEEDEVDKPDEEVEKEDVEQEAREATFLTSFRGVQEWTQWQVMEKGLDIRDKLKAVDFGTLPEVITRSNNQMEGWLKPDGTNADICTKRQRILEKTDHIEYPLTLVFAGEDDRHYYKLMRETQQQIVNVIDSLLANEGGNATKDMLHPVFAWILGSFDYPEPNSLKGFNAALFRESQLKKFVAHGQTSSEHFAFLKDLLGYTLALQAHVSGSRSTEFRKFDEIIQMWLRNIENKGNATQHEAGPNWESSTEEKSEIDNRKNPEDIATEQISVLERQKNYRTKLNDMITLVNFRWQRYAVGAPNTWVIDVEDYMEIALDHLKLAHRKHDFGVREEERQNAKNESWTDIFPLSVILEEKSFFQSVYEKLNESIAKANEQKRKESMEKAKNVWFVKAHQRAYGYALICVKRLYMQWCINATYVSKFREQCRDQQSLVDYENYFLQIICALTITHRLVACSRAVENMVEHELDYDDAPKYYEKDKLANKSVTRWDLETAIIKEITWQGVKTMGPKYCLLNPLNYPTNNRAYVETMLNICENVHMHLSLNLTLPTAQLHLFAFQAAQSAESELSNLRLCQVPVEVLMKKYESFKWSNSEGKKTLQMLSWPDYMPTRTLTGQWFFVNVFNYFKDLRQKHLGGTFENSLFPGYLCYSRQYKKRMQYVKVLVKRVLYMAMFNQIEIDNIQMTMVKRCIQQLYLHIELVRAIHSIQESENRSLKYMTVPWTSRIEKELNISSTPAKPPLEGHFGK